MTDLKPCPFCGGEAEYGLTMAGEEAYCKKCHAAMPRLTTKAEAIEAWNSRAERTCKFTIEDNMNETEGMGDVWIECSACHCVFDFYADEWLMAMNYCPSCGARRVGE